MFAAGVHSRDNGRMVNDMGWVWSLVGDGFIAASGRRVSRDVTVCDNPTPQPPSTRAHGRMVYKMATALKRTLMMVSHSLVRFIFCGISAKIVARTRRTFFHAARTLNERINEKDNSIYADQRGVSVFYTRCLLSTVRNIPYTRRF